MNKTLLLIIIDFLFLNLIALTRWEKVEPARNQLAPVPASRGNAPTAEQDLVNAMRQQLASESEARQSLQQELTRTGTTLTAREQGLAQIRAERAQLAASLADAQRREAALGQVAQSAREESVLTRQQLEQLQQELAERRAETERQRQEMTRLQQAEAAATKQIQGLTMAVVVDEAEKQNLQKQTQQLQSQVQQERTERMQVQASAAKLAQGVGELAQNSGELTKEIRENQPINANVLYDRFLANRVDTRFTASRPGLFGRTVRRSKDTPTLFVTDGKSVYALLHVDDTVFSTDPNVPNTDWSDIGIAFLRPPSVETRAPSLQFLAADPRVVAIPVDLAQVRELGVKVYPLASDPFKFPDAVLIGGGRGYGELPFKLDPAHPGYVRVDNRFFRRLFGDFAPSAGDLVLSHTGEVLGMMVNRDYCALLKDFTPAVTLPTGQQPPNQPAGPLLDRVAAQVQALPGPLR